MALCATCGVFARRIAVLLEDGIGDATSFAGCFAAGATGFTASDLRNGWVVLCVAVSLPCIRLFAGLLVGLLPGLLVGLLVGLGGANSSSEGTSNMSGLLVAARNVSALSVFGFPSTPFKAPPSSDSGASSLSCGADIERRADLP